MKVIFLDIDGVLNSEHWIRTNHNIAIYNNVDPLAVRRLNKIQDATKANIVLSSTWRLEFLYKENGLGKCQEFFHRLGIDGIIGMTPEVIIATEKKILISTHTKRSEEIKAYLNSRNDIEQFVIIDDDFNAGIDDHFVKTSFLDGLQDHHVDLAIRILNV